MLHSQDLCFEPDMGIMPSWMSTQQIHRMSKRDRLRLWSQIFKRCLTTFLYIRCYDS